MFSVIPHFPVFRFVVQPLVGGGANQGQNEPGGGKHYAALLHL